MQHGIPFELKIPNDKLEKAICDAENGTNIEKFDSSDEVLKNLYS